MTQAAGGNEILTAWFGHIASFLQNSSVCIGIFDLAGQALYLNTGMQAILCAKTGGAQLERFLTPTFEALCSRPTMESTVSTVYRGQFTFGSADQVDYRLRGEAIRRENTLLVIAE